MSVPVRPMMLRTNRKMSMRSDCRIASLHVMPGNEKEAENFLRAAGSWVQTGCKCDDVMRIWSIPEEEQRHPEC